MIHDCWYNSKHDKILCLDPKRPSDGDIIRIKYQDQEKYVKVELVPEDRKCDCMFCPFYDFHCRIYHHCSDKISVMPCMGFQFKLTPIDLNQIMEDL
jgi:hypothetical protein